MNCPVCNVSLNITERSGVEIDYCPKCRGIWLDRGELDKIIERNSESIQQRPATGDNYRPHDHNQGKYPQHGYGQPYKKKKNFLEDIFDF